MPTGKNVVRKSKSRKSADRKSLQQLRKNRRRNSLVSEVVRLVAGSDGLYISNATNQTAIAVDPSRRKAKTFWVRLYVKGKQEPVVSDEKSPWSRVVTYVRDSCLGAKDAKAAVRAFGRICPSGLEKNETIKEILRRPTSKPKQIGDGALSGAPSPTVPAVQEKSTERRGTGMTDDALLAFNPILKEAFDRYVDKSDPFVLDMMRQIVAAAIKTGAAPEKIYATIKTGRMLTKENMKFLSEADIKEWGDAAEEYKRLARQD